MEIGIVIVALVLIGAAALVTRPRCPQCRVLLKHIEVKDSLGVNIRKNFSLSLVRAPRKIMYGYECPQCGHRENRERLRS